MCLLLELLKEQICSNIRTGEICDFWDHDSKKLVSPHDSSQVLVFHTQSSWNLLVAGKSPEKHKGVAETSNETPLLSGRGGDGEEMDGQKSAFREKFENYSIAWKEAGKKPMRPE